MRLTTIFVVIVLATPALATNGNGQGGLKGGAGQSHDQLALGSVPMNVGSANSNSAGAAERVIAVNPGNGNPMYLPGTAQAGFARASSPGGEASAGGAGGMLSTGGPSGGGLVVSPELMAFDIVEDGEGPLGEEVDMGGTIAPVPLPATLSLLGLGLLALPFAVRRRRG